MNLFRTAKNLFFLAIVLTDPPGAPASNYMNRYISALEALSLDLPGLAGDLASSTLEALNDRPEVVATLEGVDLPNLANQIPPGLHSNAGVAEVLDWVNRLKGLARSN